MFEIIQAANLYKKLNFSIMPLIFGSKMVDSSLLEDSSNKGKGISLKRYQEQIISDDEITSLFGDKPVNIGIVCGYNNLMILDFDKAEAFFYWKELHPELFEGTIIQKTRRGYHVFLRIKKTPRKILLSNNFFVIGYKNNEIVGQVLWKGYQVPVWPSFFFNGKQRYNYSWLNKHAPWEVDVKDINSLENISISLKVNWLSFSLRWFYDPIWNFVYLYCLFLRAVGTFDPRVEKIRKHLTEKMNKRKRR